MVDTPDRVSFGLIGLIKPSLVGTTSSLATLVLYLVSAFSKDSNISLDFLTEPDSTQACLSGLLTGVTNGVLVATLYSPSATLTSSSLTSHKSVFSWGLLLSTNPEKLAAPFPEFYFG